MNRPADPGSARPDTAGPDAAGPDAAGPGTAGADTAELRTPGRPDYVLIDDLPGIDALASSLSGERIAVDVERASGFRYPDRAFLVQVRDADGVAQLVDPETPGGTLGTLAETLSSRTLILHAAGQDLPSLRELGVRPAALIDTELAGRFLGLPKVNLGAMIAEYLGLHLAKAHSAADWSTRPLPGSWLEYAAYDVLWLHELADVLLPALADKDRLEWFEAECDHLARTEPPAAAGEQWRRLSHITSLRSRREFARARALWHARLDAATDIDVAPKRVLTDASIIAAAKSDPATQKDLLALEGFGGKNRTRMAGRWLSALADIRDLPDADLPDTRGSRGPHPAHTSWKRAEPRAAALLAGAREAMTELSDELELAHELMLKPSTMRAWVWRAATEKVADDGELLDETLRADGAREWQIELTTPRLLDAVRAFRASE